MTLAVSLGVFCLWGFLAPRNQWRVLASWTYRDARGDEPGDASYALRRMLSFFGVLTFLVTGAVLYTGYLKTLPPPPRALGDIEAMWGAPDPQLVDRYVDPLSAPPVGYVDQPILGYQELVADDMTPEYLRTLPEFVRVGPEPMTGYIGSIHSNFRAIEVADLVVNMRGGLRCFPHSAVVIETETEVRIGVYYGLPDHANGTPADNAAACPAQPGIGLSLLLPIDLDAPLGDRRVVSMDGTDIGRVALRD